jgi:DNA-binding beta-propeller fold protein YncE/predicted Ser/Thr protein kinase
MTTTSDPRIGSELAGYRVESLLGRGGMGVVYRAHDLALDRPVALKILAPELAADERFRERFLRESRLAASLDHPSIVPVYDAGEVAGELYIAMRFVEGSDLKALLRDEGALEPARALRVVEQVGDALDSAHERGLVHRDVKPSNVLIDARGHSYLADFGLSRRLGEAGAALNATQSLGTVDYAAPEQIRGEDVDGRADLYSLGCLLYECLTGEPPFRRPSDAATLFAHLEEEAPAPAGLEQVMRTALAKEPEKRFQSGRELVEAARSALGLEPKRVRWPLAVAAVGLALIGAALLAFFLTRGGGSAAPAAGGRLLAVDPGSNRVARSITVGDGPRAVAAGNGSVWVASYDDGSLWKLDTSTGNVLKLPGNVGRPFGISLHGDHAYVAATGIGKLAGSVSQFSIATGGREDGLEMEACSLASGPYGVWVAGCPNVESLVTEGSDIRRGRVVQIPFAEPSSAANFREALPSMAEGEGSVWVLGDAADRRLFRLDPRKHLLSAIIPLGFPPAAVAVGGGGVWVTDELGDRLVRIDPATNRIVTAIPVGRGAEAVAFGAGSVWVTDAIAHSVTRVDPRSNRVLATIPVAARPRAVAVGEDTVWVVGDAR